MHDDAPTPTPRAAPHKRRRWRTFAWIAGTLVAVLAVVAVVFRDTPRRFVARTLARELQADVQIGRLEILGTDRFALHDVVIREPAPWPGISEIRVKALRVEGALDDIREARLDALRVESPNVLLRVPPGPAPPATDGTRPEVGRLEVHDGTLVAAAAGGTFRARFAAEFHDVPWAPAGDLTVTAASDPIAPLVAVALGREDLSGFDRPTGPRLDRPCNGLAVRVSVDASGSANASIMGTCAVRDARGETRPIGFEGDASATPSDAGHELRVTARVDPGIAIRAAGTWPGAGAPRWTSAALDVPDLGSALAIAAVLPAGADVVGEGAVRVERGPSDRLDVALDARVERASGSFAGVDAVADGARIEARAELPDDASDRSGNVRGSIELARLAASGREFDLPADLGAWATSFDGDVVIGSEPRFAGAFDLTVPGVGPLHGEGEIRVDPETGTSVDADIRSRHVDVARALAFSRRVLPSAPAGFEVAGDADVRIVARGPIAALAIAGTVDGTGLSVAHGAGTTVECARIEAHAAIAPDGGLTFNGVAIDLSMLVEDRRVDAASVTLDARGSIDTALDLTADAQGVEAHVPGVAVLDGGRVSVRARHLADRRTRIERASLTGAIAPTGWPRRTLTIVAAGDIDPDGRARVELASLELDGLVRFEASATLDRRGGPVEGSVRLVSADVPALRAWHRTGARPLLDGYDVSFAPAFESTFRVDPDGAFSARGTAGWSGLSLQSDDGARALEGLDGAMAFDADGTAAGHGRLHATGSTEGFVMLWGRVFGDYAEFRPDVEVGLRWGDPEGPAWVVDGRVSLGDALAVEARAGAAGEHGTPWRLVISVDDLEAPFERWVRAPLVDSVERLDGIRTGGGLTVDLEGTLGEDGSGTAFGAIVGRGLAIDVAETARVAGLDLELPVDLAWTPAVDGGDVRIAGAARTGRLAFERLDLSGVPVRAVSTELRVSGDTIGLQVPVEFDLLGGSVRIDSVTAAGLATAARRLEGRMEIAGVRLDRLAAALELPPLDGSLDAAFPSVSLTPDVLRVEGGGEVRVFGGVVRLGDISGENMLTRFPKLTLSAEFEGIDLQQVTRTFDFGEMTGIVNGYVRDCELFRGTPVRFDANVATVERKGVKQSITVKAINNLTVLGTGGKANVFDRGIHRFLDRYGYDELGVSARLEDDVFVLRGGARRGERELFLKGRLPFRLDVVNVRPGQSVSFRTMLDRLSRLDLSAASTSR